MSYLTESQFDHLVVGVLEITLRSEYPEDVGGLNDKFTNIEDFTELMIYADDFADSEDPSILKEEVLALSRSLADTFTAMAKSDDIPMGMLTGACRYFRNVYVRKYDRHGNKKSFLKRHFRGSWFNKSHEYDPDRVEKANKGIRLAFFQILRSARPVD